MNTRKWMTWALIALAAAIISGSAAWTLLGPDDGATVAPELAAPFAATPPDVVDRMLALANLQPGQVLYDLGSGDGRIVIRASEQYGARATGFELDPNLIALSRQNVAAAGLSGEVRIEEADIFALDLAAADVVTLYLSARANERLIPNLLAMKKGALIISHDYPLPGYPPDVVVQVTPKSDPATLHRIYAWRTPLSATDTGSEIALHAPEGAGFASTPMAVVEEMLRMASLEPGQLLYDLGSGDGRILVEAASAYGARAVGYEIDQDLIRQSRQAASERGLDHLVSVRESDLFLADLSEADVVTLYLSEAMNRRLIPQLLQLKPGARIVSHKFPIPGVREQSVLRVMPSQADRAAATIYIWTTPLELIAE